MTVPIDRTDSLEARESNARFRETITSLSLGSGSLTGRASSAEEGASEDCCAWALLLVGREDVLGLEDAFVGFLPVRSFGSHAPSP